MINFLDVRLDKATETKCLHITSKHQRQESLKPLENYANSI